MLRRPSITIYDYPEDLNPFKDDNEEISHKLSAVEGEREGKKKFWTFGRNKKKRSHSFSLKSTWNGIFGKKKQVCERTPTISTVSSTYQRASYNGHPPAPPRRSNDQREFDEALGTLARRRKHTLDNSSRCSSSLTMNGDPGRIYEGCPQETTLSIMGDLTPKPPARRFGQVSPKPTDKIPALDYSGNNADDREDDGALIPPKRGGVRSSQRLTIPQDGDEPVHLRNTGRTDENENMQEEFVFKRCNNDAVRKSNLSINSCISVGSIYASGRKKRRAPLPPGKKMEPQESHQEHGLQEDPPDPLELSKVAEDISEMTKRTRVDDLSKESSENGVLDFRNSSDTSKSLENSPVNSSKLLISVETDPINTTTLETNFDTENSKKIENYELKCPEKTELQIELIRTPEDPLEILKDAPALDDNDDVIMRDIRTLNSRKESFSVKDEIEKIEAQIKLLESSKPRTRTSSFTSFDDDDIRNYRNAAEEHPFQREGSRRSLQETRRNFFRTLTVDGSEDFKIKLGELPREQREIKIVSLGEDAGDIAQEVKIIELHISEPITKKIEGEGEINPIPKPRRHRSGERLGEAPGN